MLSYLIGKSGGGNARWAMRDSQGMIYSTSSRLGGRIGGDSIAKGPRSTFRSALGLGNKK